MVLMITMVMVIMVKVMMMVVRVMLTVLSLQDPAGLVDDSPKLTNLHGMLILTMIVEIKMMLMTMMTMMMNLVHNCSHPALRLVETKLGLSCTKKALS